MKTIEREVFKLNAIRAISLPGDLFADVAPKVLAGRRARVAAEPGGKPPPLHVGSVGVPFVISGERPDGQAGTERRHRGVPHDHALEGTGILGQTAQEAVDQSCRIISGDPRPPRHHRGVHPMTGAAMNGEGRDGAQRKADTLDLLAKESQLWLGTAAVDGTPHLIPVSFVWDGERITMGTAENSTTVRNLRRTPVARTAIGHHFDVVLIDGSVDFTSPEEIDTPTAEAFALVAHDPRHMPGYLYLRLTPRRVLAWRSFPERRGAQIMTDGRWLA